VSKDVTPDVPLSSLDKLDVGFHTLLGKRGREEVRDVGVRVQTSEGNELPDWSGWEESPL
jgi:hypothetical protein